MRKFLTICIIGISAALILAGCSNEAQTSLTDIQTAYANQDYDSAMDEIDNFKTLYAEKDPELLAEVEKISSNIEKSLFEKISSQNSAEDIETACNEYLDHFPNGQYIDSVNSRLAEAAERKAIEDINTAKEYIENKDYLEADNLLQNVINSTNVAEETIGQAKELADSIANRVATEKAKTAIIGTWGKATGVCYTFEEDGHMDVSIPGSYDKADGTTLDGYEVTKILKEIETYGRPIRGGTWEYMGEHEKGSLYSLFYDGSRHECLLTHVEGQGDMLIIVLASGMGEPSYLIKMS